MANTIKHKRGTTDPAAGDLVVGELAINTTDGGVFTKTDGGSVVEVGAGGGGGATEINDLSDAVTNSSGTTIGLGTGALTSDDGTANQNTALGYQALNSNTSGRWNTAVGYQASFGSTTAQLNTAIGYRALATGGGSQNTALGYQALEDSTSGAQNVAVGYRALANSTAASYNTAVGETAGQNITGNRNTCVGHGALKLNTSATDNVAIGYDNLDANTTGLYNTSVGSEALTANTSGDSCVAVGYRALYAHTTGADNTCVGWKAGDSITTGTNNTCIGYNADASSATATNEITLGDANVATLRCNQTSITSLSDGRDKINVAQLGEGLDFIARLKPVKFKWRTRDGNIKDGTYEAGFIAQDLQQAQQDADAEYLGLVMDSNPDRLEASYGKLVPVLVRAIQELKAEIDTLKARGVS